MSGLTLKRIAVLPQGAFGVLLWQGIPFAVSLERSYDTGPRATQITKIAPGSYQCTRTRYLRGGYDTWLITGGGVLGQAIAPERRIMFHRSNVEDESDGCVLVGEQFSLLNGRHAIGQSGAAFGQLMTLTAELDQFDLTVLNV
jgi:hypothetical protein